MAKHNSIWSKKLVMPLTIWNCVLSYPQKNNFSENLNMLQMGFSGGKLATINFCYDVIYVSEFISVTTETFKSGEPQLSLTHDILSPQDAWPGKSGDSAQAQ